MSESVKYPGPERAFARQASDDKFKLICKLTTAALPVVMTTLPTADCNVVAEHAVQYAEAAWNALEAKRREIDKNLGLGY